MAPGRANFFKLKRRGATGGLRTVGALSPTIRLGQIVEILLVAALIGLIPAYIAQKKGRSFFPWWIYGALLFIVALPHAILIKPNLPQMERAALDSGYKKCPRCAEMVKPNAKICRFCGHNFDLQSRIGGIEGIR